MLKRTTSCSAFMQDTSVMTGEGLGHQSPAHSLQGPTISLQDSSFLSSKSGEEPSGELGAELDLSFLPDEVAPPDEPGQDNLGTTKTLMFTLIEPCL